MTKQNKSFSLSSITIFRPENIKCLNDQDELHQKLSASTNGNPFSRINEKQAKNATKVWNDAKKRVSCTNRYFFAFALTFSQK